MSEIKEQRHPAVSRFVGFQPTPRVGWKPTLLETAGCRCSLRSRAAFSLIEVLCAIVILGVGITGLTIGLTTALGTSRDSEEQTTAALIAAGHLETLRAEGYVLEGESDGECEDLPQYSWRESIVETKTEGLFEVTVTVERKNKTVYELKTMLFDPPLTLEQESDPAFKERQQKREKAKQ